MRQLRARLVSLTALALWAGATAGCSNESSSPSGAGGSAGSSPSGCESSEIVLADGSCSLPGIPADGCAAGFVSDGEGSCDAVLPADRCPDGLVALPGDTACHELASCGDGSWGDIPVDAGTQYVNGSYAGGDSNGTAAQPWTTITQGLDAAAEGGIVAVAAGSYAGDINISRAVRLWGVCPALVTVEGSCGQTGSAVTVAATHDVEIHSLAITASCRGAQSFAYATTFDAVWVHDTNRQGIVASDYYQPAELVIRDSLVERARSTGIYAGGTKLTVERTVVRDTGGTATTNELGRGIYAEQTTLSDPAQAAAAVATLALRSSVLEGNRSESLYVRGADAVVDASVVRDTQPQQSDGAAGRGISVAERDETGKRSSLVITGSVLERNLEGALGLWGSDLDMDRTAIRDTSPAQSTGHHGEGIALQSGASGASNASVRRSTVLRSHAAGVFVAGANATLDSCLVADVAPEAAGVFGFGIVVQPAAETQTNSELTLSRTLVRAAHTAGIAIYDSPATVQQSRIVGTLADDTGAFGDGIMANRWDEVDTTGDVADTIVEQNARAGVASFGAFISIEGTSIDCNAIDIDGEPSPHGTVFQLKDNGGNACSCGAATRPCQVLSANLSAPSPMP